MLPRSYYEEEEARTRQIDTLKIFNEHVTELTEDAEYRVDFSVDGKSMSLQVVLPPEFPNQPPTIFINPTINHPWLAENSNEIVGAPGLVKYSQHSDLGRIVQAIIREFQRSLPTVDLENSPQHSSAHSMLPDLSELGVEELTEILESTDLQDRLLESNPELAELEVETEEVLSSIEKMAQDNLSKQQTLDELKTDLIDRISSIVQLKMNYEELNRKHQRLAEMYDPHRIRDCLKEAALKADEDAETIAEQFLLGNVPVETFVTKFAEKRALGQARRAREERLAHQLTQLDRATT